MLVMFELSLEEVSFVVVFGPRISEDFRRPGPMVEVGWERLELIMLLHDTVYGRTCTIRIDISSKSMRS